MLVTNATDQSITDCASTNEQFKWKALKFYGHKNNTSLRRRNKKHTSIRLDTFSSAKFTPMCDGVRRNFVVVSCFVAPYDRDQSLFWTSPYFSAHNIHRSRNFTRIISTFQHQAQLTSNESCLFSLYSLLLAPSMRDCFYFYYCCRNVLFFFFWYTFTNLLKVQRFSSF